MTHSWMEVAIWLALTFSAGYTLGRFRSLVVNKHPAGKRGAQHG